MLKVTTLTNSKHFTVCICVCVYACAYIHTYIHTHTHTQLSKIERWSRRNKIRFNERKSKVMLVTRRKRKENKKITLCLHFRPIEQVTQMKYLGIILDQKFRFQEHIKYAAESCTKLIYRMSQEEWTKLRESLP